MADAKELKSVLIGPIVSNTQLLCKSWVYVVPWL